MRFLYLLLFLGNLFLLAPNFANASLESDLDAGMKDYLDLEVLNTNVKTNLGSAGLFVNELPAQPSSYNYLKLHLVLLLRAANDLRVHFDPNDPTFQNNPPYQGLESRIRQSLNWVEGIYANHGSSAFCTGRNWNNSHLGIPLQINKIFAALKNCSNIRITDPAFPQLKEQAFMETPATTCNCGIAGTPIEGGDGMQWREIQILHHYNRGLFSDVPAILKTVIDVVENNFYTPQGLRSDFTFHDHDNQLYITRYGYGYLHSCLKIDKISQFVDERLLPPGSNARHLILEYARRFQTHKIYYGQDDFNAMGRGAAVENSIVPKQYLKDVFQLAKDADPGNAALYDQVINETPHPITWHAHSWKSDFMVHRRPNYYFSVRMVSNRLLRQERSADVNVQNRFTSLGATNINLDGTQYGTYITTADFPRQYFPGVTCYRTNDLSTRNEWGISSETLSPFCGGVSSENVGVTAYSLVDVASGTSPISTEFIMAKKAWFCFDEKIVCLGMDIIWKENSGNGSVPGFTCINQALSKNNLSIKANGTQQAVNNTHLNHTGPLAIWQDRIGYQVLSGHEVYVAEGPKGPFDTMEVRVKHTLQDNDYAYIIRPDMSSADFFNLPLSHDIQVLQNSNNIQAVYEGSSDILQVVFYEKGSLSTSSSETVTVDQPCILMFHGWKNSTQKRLTIADPNQDLSEIRIHFSVGGWEEQAKIPLPQGEYKGQTVNRTFNQAVSGTNKFIYPVMDAYVRDGSFANDNFGSATTLVVKNDLTGYKREAYFKFNLKSLAVNHEGSAVLRVKLLGSPNGLVENFGIYRAENDNWKESGYPSITDANKPAVGDLLATTCGENGDYLQFDLTRAVQEELAENRILTLVLRSLGNNNQNGGYFSLAAREHNVQIARPRLIFPTQLTEIVAVEDAYVDSQKPTTNFETSQPFGLKVKNASGSLEREIYLKFPLNGINISQGNRGRLRMYCSNSILPAANLTVYRVPRLDWSEGSVNWQTRPYKSTPGDVQYVDAPGFVEWDISELLFQAVAEGESHISLKIESDANNYQEFLSRSSAPDQRPTILIDNFPSITSVNSILSTNQLNTCAAHCYATVDDVYVSGQPGTSNFYGSGPSLVDCDFNTGWSSLAQSGAYEYAEFLLDGPSTIESADLAFYQPHDFFLALYGANNVLLNTGNSAFTATGNVGQYENFAFTSPISGVEKIRYFGKGNNNNAWAGLSEARFKTNASCSGGMNKVSTDEQRALLVFPNPTTEEAHVLHLQEGERWKLFSTSGSLVLEGKASVLDLSQQASGLYFLKTNRGRVVKVVKSGK